MGKNAVMIDLSALRRFAYLAGAVTMLGGGLVLAGWVFGFPILTRIRPIWAAMVPTTAGAFVLLGMSLCLSVPRDGRPIRRRAAQALALAVIGLEVFTLTDRLLRLGFGLDRLLISRLPEAALAATAPHTALGFVLLSLSLLLLGARGRAGGWPAQFLALGAALIGLLTAVGYLYGVAALVGAMALHTALAFILMSAGILAARPDSGLMAAVVSAAAGGLMVRRLSAAVIGLPLITGWLILRAQRADYFSASFGFALFAVSLIVAFAVVGLSNARSLNRLDSARQKAKELSDALNDINALINSTLDIDAVMPEIVVRATRVMGTESGVFFARQDKYWIPSHFFQYPDKLAAERLADDELPIAALAEKSRQLIVVDDALADDRVNRQLMQRYGIRSFLSLPLMFKQAVIGVLYFGCHSAAVAFTASQIDFAVKFGASMTLALENSRLYQQERNISHTLQQALLTVPESLPGIEFGHLYRSATIEAAEVGGDFYDLFELEHGRVGLVIGDVEGKGLRAATLTSLVKNTIKAYAYRLASPAEVMRLTNEIILKTAAHESIMTVFLGILNTRSGTLRYCRAGHEPPILLKKTGVSTLAAGSAPIGVLPDLDFVDDEARIEPGEILIMYTDGVTEARRDGEFFGEDRLFELVKTMTGLDAPEIPAQIFDAVSSFSGGKLSDDVAVLAVSPAVR